MSTFDLGSNISILNKLPWFSDSRFATIADAKNNAVWDESKVIYIEDEDPHWFTYDAEGNVIPFQPSIRVTQPKQIFVASDAAAGGDGASWDTAYSTVIEAFANATDQCEILIAEGTYTVDSWIKLDGVQNVKVYGGLEKGRSKDARIGYSVFSGDVNGDGTNLATQGLRVANSYQFDMSGVHFDKFAVDMVDLAGALAFNGVYEVTLTDIKYTNIATVWGLMIKEGTMTIKDSIIEGVTSPYIGGISSSYGGVARLSNVLLKGNSSGLGCLYAAENGSIIGDNVILEENDNAGNSNSISCFLSYNSGNIELSRSVIRNNSSAAGHICWNSTSSTTTLINSLIYNNTSSRANGGVITADTGSELLTLINCTMHNPSDAFCVDASNTLSTNKIQAENCIFSGNVATTNAAAGVEINYSLSSVAWTGNGANNVTGEADFADSANEDFRLLYTSVARGIGHYSTDEVKDIVTSSDYRKDLSGNAIKLGNATSAMAIDAGCYQFYYAGEKDLAKVKDDLTNQIAAVTTAPVALETLTITDNALTWDVENKTTAIGSVSVSAGFTFSLNNTASLATYQLVLTKTTADALSIALTGTWKQSAGSGYESVSTITLSGNVNSVFFVYVESINGVDYIKADS